MFCQFCGTPMPENARFCTNCGRQQPGGEAASRQYVIPANVRAQTGRWFTEGWNVVQSEWGMFALIALIFLVISGVVPVVLQGAMIVGIHIVCWRKLAGGPADINDLFKGFNYFVPALAAFVVISVFATAGFLLCIIPGFVILAMYTFTYLFIADKKMDFWAAMQASHAIVRQDYFGFTWFIVLAALINIAGALLFGAGLLVSIPLTYAAITAAYRDIAGFEPGGVM